MSEDTSEHHHNGNREENPVAVGRAMVSCRVQLGGVLGSKGERLQQLGISNDHLIGNLRHSFGCGG